MQRIDCVIVVLVRKSKWVVDHGVGVVAAVVVVAVEIWLEVTRRILVEG